MHLAGNKEGILAKLTPEQAFLGDSSVCLPVTIAILFCMQAISVDHSCDQTNPQTIPTPIISLWTFALENSHQTDFLWTISRPGQFSPMTFTPLGQLPPAIKFEIDLGENCVGGEFRVRAGGGESSWGLLSGNS